MPRTRKPGATDRVTRRWVRNAADEKAAKAGARFDEARAAHAVEWIQTTCHLYEGELAGTLMHLADWQLDTTQRLFGWVVWSDDWGREVRRFRRASIWVPKKNGKSPTIAAWGLYLLCADGEQGQKVYSVAKDGRQAMISHQHALEMVKRSPLLNDECTVNKTTGQITHHPTSSVYKVVAGDNPQSQEGLNGSLMVDETHVVDRALMRILRGAGISRSEPLHVEVSTAGNNPDGYGKERYDYARTIEKDGSDQGTFTAVYEAPQDLSDADLDADPARYGRLANPSWGRIVKPGEFLAEYDAVKHSLSDLADFKMYRLGVWQASSSPWLRETDWAKCERAFAEAGLAGRECYAGLDLSKTRDMSSLQLAFPDPDEAEACQLLSYFWLPEGAVARYGHLIPLRAWAAQGLIELTPGDVIDYGFIRARFRKLAALFAIKELAYDPTYAEETTQALEQGVTDDKGQTIEEGTGVVRYVFRQRVMEFAEPTADFERLVIAGKLRHNGHAVMTWQVGHAQVKTDANQNKRPVKPKPDDYRKVDGVVAAIMALARALKAPRPCNPTVEVW